LGFICSLIEISGRFEFGSVSSNLEFNDAFIFLEKTSFSESFLKFISVRFLTARVSS